MHHKLGRAHDPGTPHPLGRGLNTRGHLTERAKIGLLSQRLVRQLKGRRYFHLWTLWTAWTASHEHEMVAQVTINCQSSGFTTFYSGEMYFHLCAHKKRSYKGVILFAWLWQKQDCSRNICTLENCGWRTALPLLLFQHGELLSHFSSLAVIEKEVSSFVVLSRVFFSFLFFFED